MIASVVVQQADWRFCIAGRSSANQARDYRARSICVVVAILVVMMLSGCGIGYQIVPARLAIVDVSREDSAKVGGTLHDILTAEGFEDLGKYQEMIALIRRDTTTPDKMKR